MTGTKGRLLFSALFFVAAVLFFGDALTFSRMAGQLPLMVSAVLAVLAGLEVRSNWVAFRKGKEGKEGKEREQGEKTKSIYAYFFHSSHTGILMLLLGLVCILVLGVVYGVSLFNLMTLKLVGRKTWPFSLALSVGLYLLIYVVFIRALHIAFYRGVFGLL